MSVHMRVRALSALGYQTDLVTYPMGQDIHFDGLRIHRTPRIPFIKEVRVGPSLAKALMDAILFFKALRLMLTRKYDFIHSHEEAAFLAIALSFLFRVPHVYDMHSSLPQQLRKSGKWGIRPLVRLFELFERWAVKTCRVVITIDPDLEKYARRLESTANVITIENLALDPDLRDVEGEKLQLSVQELELEGTFPVVYTGTLEEYQGLHLVMESARIVAAEEPRARFLLVGGTPAQVSHWRRIANRMNLDGTVRFIGSVSPQEAWAYLQLGQVLVSPRIEGTSVPLKIYTYLLAGKAIVATRVASQLQVLDSDLAYLVEPTGEALARGILTLLGDPELRARLGEQARTFAAKRYSYGAYLEKIGRVYDRRIGERDGAPTLPKAMD